MRKLAGMNRHQKAVYRPGERRLAPQEIPELLELAASDDAADRLMAAENLCPCHVRRRVDAVWKALYLLMEDPDVAVRRAAWHTLEDGGRPNDPDFERVLDRALSNEEDASVRGFVEHVAGPRREKERVTMRALAQPPRRQRGRCDFCGEGNVFIERDLDTMIPSDPLPRAALICDACARNG